MRSYLLIILWLVWQSGICAMAADEEREGFVVTFFDKKVKIITPSTAGNDLALSLENFTLGPLSGKLVDGKGDIIKYFTLESKAHQSIVVGAHLSKRVFIIPLNPPGQDIELKIGQSAYEIPPSEN